MLDHKLPYKILALVTVVAICLSALWKAVGFTMVVTGQSDRSGRKGLGRASTYNGEGRGVLVRSAISNETNPAVTRIDAEATTALTTDPVNEAGLWVANFGSQNLLQFSSADLALSGAADIAPIRSLNNAGEFKFGPHSMAFDSNSNLWVVDGTSIGHGGAIYGFTACQLSSLDTAPAPAPALSLIPLIGGLNGFDAPLFAAFDTSGNLWVTDFLASRIFKFTAAQLSTGGAVDPAAVLDDAPTPPVAFNGPQDIAFDSSGNLWTANFSNSTITEIAKPTLDAASGPALTPVVPSIVLEPSVFDDQIFNTIDGPQGILFDAQGNLWFDNVLCQLESCVTPLGGSLVQFAAASITGPAPSPIPSPAVLITSNPLVRTPTSSLNLPVGINMDANGNLFVANAVNSSVAEYTADQLFGLGNPVVPHLVITGGATGLNFPLDVVFQAAPTSFVGGTALVTNPVDIQSTAGATVSGGAFQVTNTTDAYLNIASVNISLDNGDLFSSTKLTGTVPGMQESSSSIPTLLDPQTLTYQFDPPLIVPAGSIATFTYNLTIVTNPSVTMRMPSVMYAGLFGAGPRRRPPYLAAVGGALMLLGVYTELIGISWRRKILALIILLIVAAASQIGCGGGGSTSLGAFTSTQQVTSVNSCGPITIDGLPIFLSKISVPQ